MVEKSCIITDILQNYICNEFGEIWSEIIGDLFSSSIYIKSLDFFLEEKVVINFVNKKCWCFFVAFLVFSDLPLYNCNF